MNYVLTGCRLMARSPCLAKFSSSWSPSANSGAKFRQIFSLLSKTSTPSHVAMLSATPSLQWSRISIFRELTVLRSHLYLIRPALRFRYKVHSKSSVSRFSWDSCFSAFTRHELSSVWGVYALALLTHNWSFCHYISRCGSRNHK